MPPDSSHSKSPVLSPKPVYVHAVTLGLSWPLSGPHFSHLCRLHKVCEHSKSLHLCKCFISHFPDTTTPQMSRGGTTMSTGSLGALRIWCGSQLCISNCGNLEALLASVSLSVANPPSSRYPSKEPCLYPFSMATPPLWGIPRPYLSGSRQSSRPARTAQRPGPSGTGSGSACCSRWTRRPRGTGRQNPQLRASRDNWGGATPQCGETSDIRQQHRQMSGHSTSRILDSSQKE